MHSIRPIVDPDDYPRLEALQRDIWGMSDLEILPGREMHALAHSGAQLHGAYDGDRLIGFCFGVIGTVAALEDRIDPVAAARLKMYSVIMGVLPAYQGQGVGYDLKLAQRDFAHRIGIRLITWTYDPLESRNAWLNIGKLGCICEAYLCDFHGPLGGINAGLSTDRFEASWWITTNRVKSRTNQDGRRRRPLDLGAILGGGAVLINEARLDDPDLPRPPEAFDDVEANLLLVEIPADFQRIKHRDMGLARAWRRHTRALFEHVFSAGYVVTDFAREGAKGQPARSFYVLTHRSA